LLFVGGPINEIWTQKNTEATSRFRGSLPSQRLSRLGGCGMRIGEGVGHKR